ncbi:MAG TPA: hypothetical protein VMA36_15235 [Candidatus Limnocylindria bacterium]|jgi:hypothetical protein|nr:hypothetical protein [Candidatus Limnocylindria bacterium]
MWGPQTTINQDGVPETSGGYDLHVRFVNSGNQPIRRIVFALHDGADVVDAGTFSPGVTVDQMLPMKSEDGGACRISSVTFADGTHWSAQKMQ